MIESEYTDESIKLWSDEKLMANYAVACEMADIETGDDYLDFENVAFMGGIADEIKRRKHNKQSLPRADKPEENEL